MEDNVSELEDFLHGINDLLSNCQLIRCDEYDVRAEHRMNKMEDYIQILVAMKLAVVENTDANSRLCLLLENLVDIMTRELEMLHENVSSFPIGEVGNFTPAYNITKSQIEHLKETGLSWCKIAEFF